MGTYHRYQVQSTKEIQKVIVITLCWVTVLTLLYLQEYYSKMELIHSEKITSSYEFWPDFMVNLFLGILGGLLGGMILVSKKPFLTFQKSYNLAAIGLRLLIVIFYLLITAIVLFVTRFIFITLKSGIDSALENCIHNFMLSTFTPSFFITMAIWGLLVSATRLMLQINDKLGQGVLWKFIIGKYHRPSEEERIFMFLDLKGATSIAEKMESGKFFGMLREFYKDITEPIVESSGEIYQYVGDEIVISWPVHLGIRENNALLCFFRIERKIAKQKSKYITRYGVVPTLKAGLHIGKATMGEVGVVKKEIIYSGDVLNTTSRIQALCNHYEVRILISTILLQLMKLESKFINIPLGEIGLRGKEQKIALSTVQVI